ncbi:hypothetical protein SADUNF_Sadunf02G0132000 [Salix dunnii]|uniref:Uncharacterized protein n=1 Tax=Salix dunnii TaxID=1413687 RepID=A0A835TJA0_9ROSI|nr:hypothetical protein SADUNF_Sadunf02G0132000 [Salix dunnii]
MAVRSLLKQASPNGEKEKMKHDVGYPSRYEKEPAKERKWKHGKYFLRLASNVSSQNKESRRIPEYPYDLARRRRQHKFELQREKELQEKQQQKLQAKKNKMKVHGKDKKKQKKGGGGFQVGKRKVKTKLSALAKAKVDQAMQLD